MSEDQASNVPPAVTTPTVTQAMAYSPPVITASMMPRPDPSIEIQSAEDWMLIFNAVAESLISIYRTVGQEAVGQRQALATLPSLLNRNESEKRLATRIISECATIAEAKDLVVKTIGNLENECQRAESIFELKRGKKSLEDFYALLVEKERVANIGLTNVMKKFISELPAGVKASVQKKFGECRKTTPNGELPAD